MSALIHRLAEEPFAPAAERKPLLALADEASTATFTPVHELQLAIELAFAPEPHVEKWPAPVRLGILFCSAVLPWASLVMLLRGRLN